MYTDNDADIPHKVNSSDLNQWHGYPAGDNQHLPSFSRRSRARYSRFYPPPVRHEREIYPFFYISTSSLCVSVKWRRRWDWRQKGIAVGIHHLYSCHRHYYHYHYRLITATTCNHLHVVVELVYTQRWGFCRFDKVVSRTQSSTARLSKFRTPIRDQFARPCRNLAFELFWNYYSSFSFHFLFYLVSSEQLLFFFFSFSYIVLIYTNAKMR